MARQKKTARLPAWCEIVETVDGEFMILINGFQTGSSVDRSGAGSDTYPTKTDAIAAAQAIVNRKATVYTPAMIAAMLDAPWYWGAQIRDVAKQRGIAVTSVTPIADVVAKLRGVGQ